MQQWPTVGSLRCIAFQSEASVQAVVLAGFEALMPAPELFDIWETVLYMDGHLGQ
jgi:hypothetical protein